MVTPIFFDSTFLIAIHNQKDPHFVQAKEVSERVLADFYPYARVVTDYIFDETVTGIKDRGRNTPAAILAAQWLRNECRLEAITPQEFEEAYGVFVGYRDKAWSFTDCTSYVWIKDHGIKYAVSMDSDFDLFGFVQKLVRR